MGRSKGRWTQLAGLLLAVFGISEARAAADPSDLAGRCVARSALEHRAPVLAEIALETSIRIDAALPRTMLVIGDQVTRQVELYENGSPQAPECFRLRQSGYAWASLDLRRKSQSLDLAGLDIRGDLWSGSRYCDRIRAALGMKTRCLADFATDAPGASTMVGKNDTLAAWFVANMSYAEDGRLQYAPPRLWRFYRDRSGGVRILIGELGERAAFLTAGGQLVQLRAVAGDARLANNWRVQSPPLPGTTLVTRAAQLADANPARLCAPAAPGDSLIASAVSNGSAGYPIEVRAGSNGGWTLTMLPTPACRVVLLEGHGLHTADYVIDQFQQPARFANRYLAEGGVARRCESIRQIQQAMGDKPGACASLAGVIAAEGGAEALRGQALHGFAMDAGGTEHEFSLFASAAGNRQFRLYQTWPDGVTRLALEGRDFTFVPALQELHFADRRKGERELAAAKQVAEQQAKQRAAFAAQQAGNYAALARQAEAERLVALAEAERRRRAAMTPQQRLEEHIREENAKVLAFMDEVVARDSRGWLIHRYKTGSMRNLNIHEVSADGRSFHARADYTFNNSVTGWVDFRFVEGRVACIEYWDAQCRPVGWNNSNILQMLFGDLP